MRAARYLAMLNMQTVPAVNTLRNNPCRVVCTFSFYWYLTILWTTSDYRNFVRLRTSLNNLLTDTKTGLDLKKVSGLPENMRVSTSETMTGSYFFRLPGLQESKIVRFTKFVSEQL